MSDVDVTRAEHQLQLVAAVGASCQSIGAQIRMRADGPWTVFLEGNRASSEAQAYVAAISVP